MGREGEDSILQAKYRWREISDLKSVMCFPLICTTYMDPNPSSLSCAESPREMKEREGTTSRQFHEGPEKFLAIVSCFLLHSLEETNSSEVVKKSQPDHVG